MSSFSDLGSDHSISIAVWDPDLDLNPDLRVHAAEFPVKISAVICHKLPDGNDCEGAITFDSPMAREFFKGPFWTVVSWDPLTITPSLKCHCGDHGFITDGRWIIVP